MTEIIRGTTPTIVFTFSDISTSEIVDARLVIRQCGNVIIEKGIDEAEFDENAIYWALTQKNTLRLKPCQNGVIVCDWLLDSELRGRSKELRFSVGEPAINEVIGAD